MSTGIEAAIASLSGDPAVSGLLGPGAAIVVLDEKVERVLGSTPAAARFLAQACGSDGRLAVSDAARARLRAMVAEPGAARVQRIRFGSGEASSPTTLLCRPVTLAGEPALAAILLDPAQERGDAAAGTGATALLDRIRRQGVRRFIWSLDASGRFTSVSAPLAEVVGQAGADLVGRRWQDLVGREVVDESGRVASLIAGEAAWSDQTVIWRITDTAYGVPVELGGMPATDATGAFAGFRGYGLCRTGDAAPLAEPERPRAAERPERATLPAEPEAAAAETVANFETLRAQVGAQLGGSRLVALRPVPDEPAPAERPILSSSERGALREIAKALGARLETDDGDPEGPAPAAGPGAEIVPIGIGRPREPEAARIFDRLPLGMLVCRGEAPLYANRFVLDLLGFRDRSELAGAGGLARLFAGRVRGRDPRGGRSAPVMLVGRSDEPIPVEVHLITIDWLDQPASLLLIRPAGAPDGTGEAASLRVELAASEARREEAQAILDRVPVAAVTLDGLGRILGLNGGAERLFGYAQNEVAGESHAALLAPEDHPAAADLLVRARSGPDATGELSGRLRDGAVLPLAVAVERLPGPEGRFLLLARDLSGPHANERDLRAARASADAAGGRQSAFLARVNHEIRTPLNAIIGFAEVMLEERFGPVGSERYRGYLRDIHVSGQHVVSLVNDLLDLAKVEAGKTELLFTSLDLAAVVADTLGLVRALAADAKVVLRSAVPEGLPRVIADERAMRQIAINLVSNAIRFTRPGGQIIVSGARTEEGGVTLAVRDTGIGMSPDDLAAALEPFRQVSPGGSAGGTGLGLPLAKALAEANRTRFAIASEPGAGTLATVTFPPARVLAEEPRP